MRLISYMLIYSLLVLGQGCVNYVKDNEKSLSLYDRVDVCIAKDAEVKEHYFGIWWTVLLRSIEIALPVKEIGPSVANIAYNKINNDNSVNGVSYFNDIKKFARQYPEYVEEEKSLGLIKINFDVDLTEKDKTWYDMMVAGTTSIWNSGRLWHYVTPDFMTHESSPKNLLPSSVFFASCNASIDKSDFNCERSVYSDDLIFKYKIKGQEMKEWKSIDERVRNELKSLVRRCKPL